MTSHDTTTVSGDQLASLPTDELSVVIPAYNEGAWVGRAVAAVRAAARAAQWDVDVVVVDDGSDDPESVSTLDDLAAVGQVRLVRQENSGRFAARAAGIEQVRTPYVLLLDARVEVDVDSLSRIRAAVREGVDVWNYDVTGGSTTVGALFWTGITKVWWRDYFRDRRRVSFGPEDFDRFPKGTGAFFAPVDLLRGATGDFDSLFADDRLASDDTRLLLEVAARRPITLAPDVTCRHYVKPSARAWCRQCFYRGTTFVDGYLSDGRHAMRALGLLSAAGLLGLTTTVLVPRVALLGVLAGGAAAAAVTRWSGGSSAESASVGLLSAPFGLLFGAGAVRGLRMAAEPRA